MTALKVRIGLLLATLGGLAMLFSGAAHADTAYAGGLFGVRPTYQTITPPAGIASCNPSGGCEQIKYDNTSVQSAQTKIAAWVAAHGSSGNTIYVYSESADGANAYLNSAAGQQDHNTWVMLGDPSTPGNNNTSSSWIPLQPNHGGTVIIGVKQYDSVADYPAGSANNARNNATIGVHTNGYNNLDMTKPAATYVDPTTGVTVYYYLTEPLPEISTGGKTQAQINAEDQAKRPGIESQYTNRPVTLPNPTYPVSTTKPRSYAVTRIISAGLTSALELPRNVALARSARDTESDQGRVPSAASAVYRSDVAGYAGRSAGRFVSARAESDGASVGVPARRGRVLDAQDGHRGVVRSRARSRAA